MAYGLTASNDPQRPYVWVLDEAIAPWVRNEAGEDTLFPAAAWNLWRLDLATGQARPEPAVPAGAAIAPSVWYESRGRRLIVNER